jgi:hypothetical protein
MDYGFADDAYPGSRNKKKKKRKRKKGFPYKHGGKFRGK